MGPYFNDYLIDTKSMLIKASIPEAPWHIFHFPKIVPKIEHVCILTKKKNDEARFIQFFRKLVKML